MPKMNRKQIEEAVKRGEHVAVGPVVLRRDPVTLRPDPVAFGAALATPPDPERPDEFEGILARTSDGKLTRAGMEHAIRSGGSVMLGGNVIDNLNDLPDEVTLAQHDEERLQAHTAALDAQIAGLAQQRAQAQQAVERARGLKSEQLRGEETGAPADQERQAEPGAPSSQARDLPEGVSAHPGQPQLGEGEGEDGGRGRRHRR